MVRFNTPLKNFAYLCYRWISAFIDPVKLIRAVPNIISYLWEWMRYKRLPNAEKSRLIDSFPNIHDKTSTTPFLRHYFYQDIWAFRNIVDSKAAWHVDVASRIDFVGMLTTVTHVTFIDIRPLLADLINFDSRAGSILAMPFEDNSIPSLSCLHVAEHIGLGRYGDPLDPEGTKKACKELARVLAKGGNLYFSLPVGKPRLCFNAHRIHAPETILSYFSDLKLVHLSGINDENHYFPTIEQRILDSSDYACGLFHFTKV